jgi:hypothetical protein
VRHTRVWAEGMGLAGAVVERVELEVETNTVVVAVRVGWQDRDRCGICRRRSPGFDLGRGRRRWRALDLGTTVTELKAVSINRPVDCGAVQVHPGDLVVADSSGISFIPVDVIPVVVARLLENRQA